MDHFSNRITSIRNGELASRRAIVWPIPKGAQFKNLHAVLHLLRQEGIIRGFSFSPLDSNKKESKTPVFNPQTQLTIYLKYDAVGKSVVRSVFRVSTPGRRIYVSADSLWQPQSTSGFYVLATTLGILTDIEARRLNVGGEILFGIT